MSKIPLTKEGEKKLQEELKNGGPDRNRTDVQGFAVLCITTLPPGHFF